MNDRRRAKSCVWPEGTAALLCLRKLVRLAKISFVVRIIHSIVEAAGSQRVPRINTERAAIGGAGRGHFCLAALVADHGPTCGRGAIAKGHAFDLDWRES